MGEKGGRLSEVRVKASELLTAAQIATRVGVTAKTVRGWITGQPGVRHIKLPGGGIRVCVADFETWLAARECNQGKDAQGSRSVSGDA